MDKVKITDLITKFNGDSGEDVEIWLDRLDVAVNLMRDEDAECQVAIMMPMFLTGAAYATWKQLTAEEKKNLNSIKKALRRVYGKSKQSAWLELRQLRLLPGESVDVLADTVTNLLKIVANGKEVPEEIISAAFLDALPSHVADSVRLFHGESMELAAVVSCAKSLICGQVRENFACVGSKVNDVKNVYEREHDKSINGTKEFDIICHCCQKPGHVRKNCHIKCFNCGEAGHFFRDCRRRKFSGNAKAEVASQEASTTSARKMN